VITVEGLPELSAKLTELGVVKIPLAMRRVTVAGAKPLRAAIRTAASGMFVGQSDQTPGGLLKGIRYKQVRGSKGMEYVIGPFGAGTAHRALVIGGHEVVGHAPNLTHTGKRTTPRPFVEEGRNAAQGTALAAIEVAAKAAIETATKL
jgi:hypothetical protein